MDVIEVKSSGTGKHESLSVFAGKYSQVAGNAYVLSQKDLKNDGAIRYVPVYMADFLLS